MSSPIFDHCFGIAQDERRPRGIFGDMRLLCLIAFVSPIIVVAFEGATIRTLGTEDVEPNLSLMVLDTDMGTDDAYALLMLLKVDQLHYDKDLSRGPKVIAVTCVSGNTNLDNVVNNALKILNLAGRLDGSIQVYRGASKAILKMIPSNFYFGKDGMGDVPEVSTPSLEHVNTTHAAVALVDLVNRHPGEISLLAIGPLTNIALAIRLDTNFLKKLKHLVILGGATEGRGNAMPGVEFNFQMDPEANYIVLKDTEYNNNTISILSWEAVEDVSIELEWRLRELGALKSPWMDLLNKAETQTKYHRENKWWEFGDPIAAALLIRPHLAGRQLLAPLLAFTEGEARGGIAVDYYGKLVNATSVRFFRDINRVQYKNMLLEYLS